MKKPNITKGKWQEVAPNAVGSITIEEDVCYVANTKNDNIKAISAVPEMIDALKKVYNDYDKRGYEIGSHSTLAKIEYALKKAGAEL